MIVIQLIDMKTLADGSQVTDRSYFFLLDWNEQDDWVFMYEEFDKEGLKALNIDEYIKLFMTATLRDTRNFKRPNEIDN